MSLKGNEEEVRDEFDLIVHKLDPVTGKVVGVNPYTRISSKEDGVWYVRDGKKYREGSNEPEGDSSDLIAHPVKVIVKK